jgi:hypothetical protein
MIVELTQLLSASTLEWIPRLTLLFLLACQPWRVYMPSGTVPNLLGIVTVAMATLGLLLPSLAAAPIFWFTLAAIHLAWVATAYYIADNHHYLQGYWCLAVGIALSVGGSAGERTLERSAELLVGLSFALAVIMKLVSRSYRAGSFFTAALLSDPRFASMAVYLCGADLEQRSRHLVALSRIRAGVSAREDVAVPRGVWRMALWLTWWTIAIEMVVAILFLAPGEPFEVWRVSALVLFAVTTFVFVPVPSFGEILLIMVLASTSDERLRVYVLLLAIGLALLSFVPQMAQRATLAIPRIRAQARYREVVGAPLAAAAADHRRGHASSRSP